MTLTTFEFKDKRRGPGGARRLRLLCCDFSLVVGTDHSRLLGMILPFVVFFFFVFIILKLLNKKGFNQNVIQHIIQSELCVAVRQTRLLVIQLLWILSTE